MALLTSPRDPLLRPESQNPHPTKRRLDEDPYFVHSSQLLAWPGAGCPTHSRVSNEWEEGMSIPSTSSHTTKTALCGAPKERSSLNKSLQSRTRETWGTRRIVTRIR